MKACPVCALEVEDTYSFCPDDGSSLRSLEGTPVNEPAQISEANDETAGSVVLYCPTCATEYPLTFSECPAHRVKLTKHNIFRLSNRVAAASVESESSHSNPTETPGSNKGNSHDPAQHEPQLAEVTMGASATAFHYQPRVSVPFSRESAAEPDRTERLTEVHEGFEQPRFRVAAIATVIGLAVFAVVAAYAFLSNLSRRPPAPAARITEASSQPFVPTPQEARDYTEAQSETAPPKAPEPQADRTVEPKSIAASSRAERIVPAPAVAQSNSKPVAPAPASSSTDVSNAQLPPLPRGGAGGFDARLIRVRSNRTPSGVRYDLTFNMQEQAGRSAQWQRVLITTKSASGVNHTQAIPFTHRLGATGALTFTISVELGGHSEADWHGRVVCTTLGWDNQGAPLQASFGANLTP